MSWKTGPASPSLQKLIAAAVAPSFAFSAGGLPFEARVVSFRGRESLSRPYRVDVTLEIVGGHPQANERALLGTPVCLTLYGADGDRAIRGIVARARFEGFVTGTERQRHQVRIVPKLWLLRRTRNTRIFQDKSASEIIDAILKPHRIEHAWSLSTVLASRPYCVQHQETDLAFVHRLLQEEGVFYFFDHGPADGESSEHEGAKVVFGDATMSYGTIPGASVPFRDRAGMSRQHESISRFITDEEIVSGATLLHEYDFKRPALNPTADAKADPRGFDESHLRVYDHHYEFEGDEVSGKRAKLHLDQHRVRAHGASGASDCRRFAIGHVFALEEHAVPELNAKYVLSRIDHVGEIAEGREDSVEATYENRFRCLPAHVTARPPRPRRRQQQSLETAMVVGPENEEIHTDKYGRIKVQFHWDNEGKRDEHSSCWLRTSQAWAGGGWGFQFVPRIGMEVLVLFIQGDTDRPIVVGAAYNGQTLPPFPLPTHKTKSGVRTRSTPKGTGFNELSFEDKKGEERVFLRAEKDLVEHVQHDREIEIRHDRRSKVGRDETTMVHGNAIHSIVGHQTFSVGAGQAVTIGASRISLVHGSETERVVGGRKTSTGGDGGIVVEGSQSNFVGKSRTDFVGNALRVTVGVDRQEQIGGESRSIVKKNAFTHVAGHYRLQVDGQGDPGKGAPGLSLKGGADCTAAVSGKTLLRSDEGFRLECGDNFIELTKDGITIRGKSLAIVGETDAKLAVKNTSLKLDDQGNAKLVAGNATVASSGGSLTLDSGASLSGASVKLGSGGGDKDKDTADTKKEDTIPVKMKAVDRDGKAIAGKSYRLNVEGKMLKGTTGGDGSVEQQVPKTAEQAELEIDGVDSADGGIFRMTLLIGGLAPIDQVKGVQARLVNLGYRCDVTGDLDDATKRILSSFQTTQGLTVTGDVDGPTRRKLQELCP